jgi:hypothetical protein
MTKEIDLLARSLASACSPIARESGRRSQAFDVYTESHRNVAHQPGQIWTLVDYNLNDIQKCPRSAKTRHRHYVRVASAFIPEICASQFPADRARLRTRQP